MNLSTSTLALFRALLNNVQIPATAENFDELAAQVSLARRELTAAEAKASTAEE